MWSDNETTLDFLGFQIHAEFIHEIVTNKKMLPITVGLFGDWGSGKTSVMKMLEKSLKSYEEGRSDSENTQIACLYFNGWQFEGYDDAKSSIISSILMQLGEHKKFGPKIKDKVVSLLKSVNWMRLIGLGLKNVALPVISAYLTGGASLIPSFTDTGKELLDLSQENSKDSKNSFLDINEKINWEDLIKSDKSKTDPLDIRTFRDRFSEMLDESDIDCLIVLIDDLDRCSPDRIIDNLEAIKLFLNVDNTAFVIGADPRIVRYAVENRYLSNRVIESKEIDPDTLVKDYLEKLIQIPYHLPRLSPSEIESYMTLLFCHKELKDDDFDKIIESFRNLRSRDLYSVFGIAFIKEALKNKIRQTALSEDLNLCSTIAPLITDGLKGNPRQVKRFLNAFYLRKQLAKVAKLNHIKDKVLVKLMVLEYTSPDLFSELYSWQSSQDGYPKEIRILEHKINGKMDFLKKEDQSIDFSKWERENIKKWIRMEPKLCDVDLRDYFWIVRDRMESTLSEVSMVSPAVRLIFEGLISTKSYDKNLALKEIRNLSEDETFQLFNVLKQHTVKNPDQRNGYKAFIELITHSVRGSTEAFVDTLKDCPVKLIPASVGINIATLLKMNLNYNPDLLLIIEELIRDSDTEFAKAFLKSK